MDISDVLKLWPVFAALVGVTGWNVRLEGRVNAAEKETMRLKQEDIKDLKETAKASEETKIEVVRLQEQIKNLSGLLERHFLHNNNEGGYIGR